MTLVIPFAFGLGVFMVYDWAFLPPRRQESRRAAVRGRLRRWLVSVGLVSTSPGQFLAACAAAGLGSAFVTALVAGSPAIAGVALLWGVYAPVPYLRSRRRARQRELQRSWPEAIDLLASSVRAGDTLPAAMATVAERGPEKLRDAFRSVVADHLVSGDLAAAVGRLGETLADPTSDRIVATLTLAHRVGGRELGRVLRTLASFLREDLSTRQEIEARQSWTIVAARVAAASPWVVLLMMASRPEAAGAYDSATGVVVLAGGAAATVVGYRLMVALGRLPDEPRLLAGSARAEGGTR